MKEIVDAATIQKTLSRICYEILEKNEQLTDSVLIGIQTRGVHLAERLKSRLALTGAVTLPVCELDPRPYRDDVKATNNQSKISLDLTGKSVILVDDVLYTGRTIRAAIDGLMHFGRPASVQLVVLVDRGHRELPIRPDYVGKNIPTSREEEVIVHVSEIDGEDSVTLTSTLERGN
ncbi:MAG: bifunctional pyr operon transcriptional regulator/uracil phosphoribosyltransferase PyrR [Streptococcaceae bacterium]|jgi:pyrimidine operon attenuation protein/uracil phosphoribosyltransferase|nr:bifunctional pyr operon transcriptional regulator/uracil phosphoribosyltransferase PyrR [Streptococcaceae bacterium]